MKYLAIFNYASRLREIGNTFILTELEKAGLCDIAPSHGDVLGQLLECDSRNMSELALHAHRTKSTVTALVAKLERNGMFVYESVPGTAVRNFLETDEGVSCQIEGYKDSQVTVQLEEDTLYKVYEDGLLTAEIQTNLSGKLAVNLELEDGKPLELKLVKA